MVVIFSMNLLQNSHFIVWLYIEDFDERAMAIRLALQKSVGPMF